MVACVGYRCEAVAPDLELFIGLALCTSGAHSRCALLPLPLLFTSKVHHLQCSKYFRLHGGGAAAHNLIKFLSVQSRGS
jgi:hypothetical protein